MKWFIKCIKNYTVFNGRAARPEFWYFALASAIIQISLFIIDIIIGWDVGIINGWWSFLWGLPVIGWLILILWLCNKGDDGENQYGLLV